MELMTEVTGNRVELPRFVHLTDDDIIKIFKRYDHPRSPHRESCIKSTKDLFFLRYQNCCDKDNLKEDLIKKIMVEKAKKSLKI